MELTPSYFSRFEFPLQYRGTKEDRRIKNKDYVFYCHKQLINLLTCQLVNSPTRSYVTMSSSQATCLLVNLSTRLLVNLTHLILEVNSLHTIADSRQYLVWNRVKRIAENGDRKVVAEDFNTVTFLAIDASNVNHRYVHTDVADVLCLLTIHQTVAVAVAQMAV